MLNAKSVNIKKKQVNVKLICQVAALSKAAPDSAFNLLFSLSLSLAIALLSAQTPLKLQINIYLPEPQNIVNCVTIYVLFVCLSFSFYHEAISISRTNEREKLPSNENM